MNAKTMTRPKSELSTKNECGKTCPKDKPYEVWEDDQPVII